MQLAKRMEFFKGYSGTETNLRLTKMKEEGRDVIRLGLGDPDVTPQLESIPTEIAKKAKMIWVNYPNNPTGASADIAFYKKTRRLGEVL